MAFDVDEKGNIVVKPLMGWDIAPAMDMAVIARLIYADKPADVGREGQTLQLILTPPQALELAEVLQRAAHRLMSAPKPGAPGH